MIGGAAAGRSASAAARNKEIAERHDRKRAPGKEGIDNTGAASPASSESILERFLGTMCLEMTREERVSNIFMAILWIPVID